MAFASFCGDTQVAMKRLLIHALKVLFPGAAERGEARMFGEPEASEVPNPVPD
jgi:hypothetical protein